MPGVRVIRTYDRSWLSRDLIAGHRPRHPARAAGDGLRRAGRAAGDHRAVHDRRLPRRVRARRAVADPRPRPGLVARTDDRRDDPAPRRRQTRSRRSPSPGCSRSWSGSSRSAPASPGSGSSPTCSRTRSGPGTWRARGRHLHRPAAEAVRVLDGRQRPRRRGGARSSRTSTRPTRGRSAIGLLSLAIILGLKRVSPRTPGILVAVVVVDRAVDRARPRGAWTSR